MTLSFRLKLSSSGNTAQTLISRTRSDVISSNFFFDNRFRTVISLNWDWIALENLQYKVPMNQMLNLLPVQFRLMNGFRSHFTCKPWTVFFLKQYIIGMSI